VSALLAAEGLTRHFRIRKGFLFARQVGTVRAVDGVSFSVRNGETLALVGESGCGKSTIGKLLVNLIEPTEGRIVFDGQDLATLDQAQLRTMRRNIQIVFQDPYASLNPRMRVRDIIGEPLAIHRVGDSASRTARVSELLGIVGLPVEYGERYPHEFSGGQRQRIGIARALALQPKFVVCDEAVSALDVSIQAQILNLMKDLQREFALTYLFISHNLAVVRHIADRVAVMYLGKLVEVADKDALYATPKHPYTQALLSAVPSARPAQRRRRIVLKGEIPSPLAPPPGCRFHTRCPLAEQRCRETEPPLRETASGHHVACHLV
jgi:oligopeptide/dipeptide ABC transporter ATP-binding protein